MSNKKTAVEWFFDNLKNHEIQAEHYELYQIAKQMEKEQITDAYWDGGQDVPTKGKQAEQYYNETYGKE